MSALARLAASLRRLPLRVVFAKVRHHVARRTTTALARVRGRVSGLGMTDDAFLRMLGVGDGKERWCQAFAAGLAARSIIQYDPSRHVSDRSRQGILSAADDAINHDFNLLGSGPVRVHHGMMCRGRDGHVYRMHPAAETASRVRAYVMRCIPEMDDYTPIDWHIDFISGYRWDETNWHADLRIGKVPGADVKVPWELGRQQHLVQLAKAHALTGDRRYALEIQAQILDFIAANPVGFGPQWGCPMDVAIRASNWLVAVSWLARQKSLVAGFLWRFAVSLVDHGRFIRSNLEWSAEVNGNHYVSNLAGLYFIGALCPELPGARDWRSFSRPRIESEIHAQFLADGTNFEASTAYHRLVLELFLYCALVGIRTGEPFPAEYLEVVRRAARVVRSLVFRNGEMTQIGDNDSGRFLVLDSLPFHSMTMDHLLPLCDWILEVPEAEYREDVDLSPLAFLGGRLAGRLDDQAWGMRPGRHFADSGWVVLRQGQVECIVPCGGNGQGGNGGHAHNDKLSVAVGFGPDILLVDPGTYIYTADARARNLYRSTRMHSTPQQDDREINPIPSVSTGVFTLPDHSRTRIDYVDGHSLEALHEGFGEPLRMRIQVREDALRCTYSFGGGLLKMRWYLAPGVEPVPSHAGFRLVKGGRIFTLAIDAAMRRADSYQFSPAYGRREPAAYVEADFAGSCSWSLQEGSA